MTAPVCERCEDPACDRLAAHAAWDGVLMSSTPQTAAIIAREHEAVAACEARRIAAVRWQARVKPLIEAVRAEMVEGGDMIEAVDRLLAETAKEQG